MFLFFLSFGAAVFYFHSQANAIQQAPEQRWPAAKENFDLRLNHKISLASPEIDASLPYKSPELVRRALSSADRLKRDLPGLQIQWSSLTGGPSRIWNLQSTVTAPQRGDAETIARRFLKTNPDLFRLPAGEVDRLYLVRQYASNHNGLTHLILGQRINGIDVFQSEYAVHINEDGAIFAMSGEMIPNAATKINLTRPSISAADALQIAATEAGLELSSPPRLRQPALGLNLRQEFDRAAGFGDDVPAQLAYFPLAEDEIRLAWRFILTMRNSPDMYFVMIDAERGSLLFRYNLTCYDENPLKPKGKVYTKESPRPNLPRSGNNPPEVEREEMPFHAAPFNGRTIFNTSDPHYDWWAGLNADGLVSNNTSTYLDRDSNPNAPDSPLVTAADGNFTFPIDLAQAPTVEANQKAAQANLFYWVNRYHDILYSFGFNEAAGNFQTNNFNLGGTGADPVLAEAQDGSGTNNANFSTPPDGRSGRMQMFLWAGTPQRDGDLDQGVVLHELTHGTSNRLIGNGTGLSDLQGGGMGEGWSDWFGIVLLAQETDDLNGEYAVGQYVTGNYARGIRRFPYGTSTSIYPLTFKDLRISSGVHAIGEIWCNTLLEVRAALIQKYGFKEGHRQAIQLVVDGMKLSPIAPTFVDMRNAIIAADRVNNRGANQCLLWQSFAKRGLGFRAATDSPGDIAPSESLENAPYCSDTGILAADKSNYVSGESLKLTLGDRNASGPVAVQVTSSVTGDQETVMLTPETGVAGSFLGALRIVEGRASLNDGILQGSADRSDEVSIVYNDPNTGAGSSAQIKSSAAFSREKTRFEDSVEQGNQGWIPTGGWSITSSRAASGMRSWTDSPGGNYSNSSNASLTSPLFDFSGLNEIALSFAQSFATEARYDLCVVEYSIDEGATWIRAAAFTGTQSTFAPAQISLRALDGQKKARIRFRLQADGGVVADGWYIDEIRLTGRSNNATVIPPNSTPLPVISSVSPAFGPPAGGTRVTISGSGFTETDTTSVSFDGIPATSFSVLGPGAITAVVPAHAAGPATIRVFNRNGAAGLPGGFSYYAPGGASKAPSITTLFPNSGAARGGTAVSLLGANFTPETEITFGAQKANTRYINATTLLIMTPSAAAPGTVEVSAANGTAKGSLANGFNYIANSPPSVQMLGPDGGQTFYVRGVMNIRWQSSDDRSIARHRIVLVRAGISTDIATELSGADQSYAWTIPTNLTTTLSARIRVIAIDDEGAESDAVSASDIKIAQRWENGALLPTSVQRLQVASDGQNLYAMGGRASTTTSTATITTVYKLDTTAQAPAWTNAGVAPMPAGLNGGEAVFLKGKIYVPGGVSVAAQISSQNYAYDIASNTWTTAASVPSGAFLYATASDDARGVFYLTGGNNGQVISTSFRSYDPAANAWTDLPPMSTARGSHAVDLIDNKLFIAGGSGPNGNLLSGEVYDFTEKKWTGIAPLNRPRTNAVHFVVKDSSGNPFWYVVGGLNTAGGSISGAEIYDPRTNRWTLLDESFSLNTPRALLAGAVAGDYFYAVAGSSLTDNTLINTRSVERTRIFNLSFIPQNEAPVLAVPVSLPAVPGAELKFLVSVNDLGSGVPIALSASGLPAGATFSTETVSNNQTLGTLRWTPTAAVAGQNFTITFNATDGRLSDSKTVTIRVISAGSLVAVNAADFSTRPLAADSLAAAFGVNLAIRTEVATEVPLPIELAGTSVRINGVLAPLFFVSPAQINFAVPPSITPGPATVIVSAPTGTYAAGSVQIAASAPAIFTADATGKGDAAAVATADGLSFQRQPFDLSINGRPNILLLFGTGIRHAAAANPIDENGLAESVSVTIGGVSARVLYAGAQGTFSGLDQINVEIPQSLAGQGQRRVEIVVTVNETIANRVSILVR
jgi:uncharacterized protein (TIGR03437 family)